MVGMGKVKHRIADNDRTLFVGANKPSRKRMVV